MKGSKHRVECLLNRQRPDHIPLFDLIPNDTVLQHFNGGQPVEPGDDESGIRALGEALDATRRSYFSPMVDKVEILETRQTRKYERWTVWTSHREYSSSEEFQAVKQKEIDEYYKHCETLVQAEINTYFQNQRRIYSQFGDDFYYLLSAPSPKLMGLFSHLGLEVFSYYLCDCEDVIVSLIEINTDYACRWAKALPADNPFTMVFLGEDIAYNHGPMVSPVWLRKHYFPKLKRVIDAYHERGIKVMFHSDGDLNPIMDDLVEAEIDVLNPIEIAAGMDLRYLHKRYPKLIYAGGIDVSNLLPFGSPDQIKDAVVRAIEDTQGQIMIGSSTEVHNSVPLKNFLAMRQAAIEYRW
jgi:uroporphyrinogen decarboxylase